MTATSTIPETTAAPRLRSVQVGPISIEVNVRVLTAIGIALAVTVAFASWVMTLGSFPVPVSGVVRSALGLGSNSQFDFIVRELRMPRTFVAIGVGALLATSGVIFQGIVRNPLVSPDIIGIDAGASLAAVFAIMIVRSWVVLPFAAFGGALAAAALIYVLTWKHGIAGNRMILVGIGVNALLSAITTFILLRFPVEEIMPAVVWTSGSVYASNWTHVTVAAIALLTIIPLAAILVWSLRILQLGDQTARSLGQPVERTRLALIVTGCALSAVAISVSGPIGFVAFMIPHVARMILGPITGGVLIFTAIIGGLYLLAADTVAQHFLPVALPVGVITSALGAPYFLFLLWRTNARL